MIMLGQQATLSLAFEGGQSKSVPTPNVPGLLFTQTGTSQNVSFVNGAMSSTVTINFTVTARRVASSPFPQCLRT